MLDFKNDFFSKYSFRNTIKVSDVLSTGLTQLISFNLLTGSRAPCAPDKWSATGFEPGCVGMYKFNFKLFSE